MLLYCFPRFSMTLVQRRRRGRGISRGLGMHWESLQDLTRVLPAPGHRTRHCRAVGCPLTVPQQKATALGLFFFFPSLDAILQLSPRALMSVRLLNLSSVTSLHHHHCFYLRVVGFLFPTIFLVGFCCFLSILL